MSLERELVSFARSKLPFKIIYTTQNGPLLQNLTRRLLVLDSSFNPPHRGHATLIKKSILYQFDKNISIATINTRSVLLLLSLKNADKKSTDLTGYLHRLEMIKLFAQHIFNDYGLTCSIGLTNKSLFAEKLTAIFDSLDSPMKECLKITFLLGFDTLIRLLDPKYYKGEGLEKALGPFFDRASCFVVSRDDGHYSFQSQKNYITDIRNGKFDGEVPASWADHIFLESGTSDSLKISSSSIRANIKSGKTEFWKESTYPDIVRYIVEKGLYHN